MSSGWRNDFVITHPDEISPWVSHPDYLYPFALGLRPLGLPCATTKQVAAKGTKEAERSFWLFKGGTQDAQISPWTPWSPWSFEHVQKNCTKVAEEVGRSQVAQRGQEEGTCFAVVAEWMHKGRPCFCLLCTTIVPALAEQWRPLSDHCGDHSVPPFGDHGISWATMAMVLPSFCLLRATLCHYNSFGGSRKAQGSCCSSYTETEPSGFGRPVSVLIFF